MGKCGLHVFFAGEINARRLLREWTVLDGGSEVSFLAPNEETAKVVLARSGLLLAKPTEHTTAKWLDSWSLPEWGGFEDNFTKPRFKEPQSSVLAACYGIPFWKEGPLWCTKEAAGVIETLQFQKAGGFQLLQGEVENAKYMDIARNVQALEW